MFRSELMAMRTTTTKRDELEWEIRLYDFMLLDPEARLQQYHDAREGDSTRFLIPKREVVQKLGWVVK